jgi:hypothetical protein
MRGFLGQGRNGQQSSPDVKDSMDLIWFGVGEGVVSLVPVRIARVLLDVELKLSRLLRHNAQGRGGWQETGRGESGW